MRGDEAETIEDYMKAEPQLPRLWGHQGFWQIRLRWAVAPVMLAAVLVGQVLGFSVQIVPILLIALASPIYNAVLASVFRRYAARRESEPKLDRSLTRVEVLVDYAAMFLLIYYTGGVSSPVSVFLIFHVIIAAIQFRPAMAFQLAGLAAGGLWFFLLAELLGWIESFPILYRGLTLSLVDRPVFASVLLFFFTSTLFLSAVMVTRVMRRLRDRVSALASATSELRWANDQLRSLYTMLTTIGAERSLSPVLEAVIAELARVTGVGAVAVKLLSDDGRHLRYVASHGLPGEWRDERVVDLHQSPLNRRAMEGETLVSSLEADAGMFQLPEDLLELGLHSAMLVPLRVADRVIGILGFYDTDAGRFEGRDTRFLELAGELVAIAIDNAQAYDAVEDLLRERAKSMLQVAHNLRAPLAAGLNMIDLLKDGYLGDLSERQVEQLIRLDSRLRTLDESIGQLLTISRVRDISVEIPVVKVDPYRLASGIRQTFAQEAAAKGIRFTVRADSGLPEIESRADLLREILENLVSNAIKYTGEGGEVEVRLGRRILREIRIKVRDTGIGIPAAEQEKLYSEFFRASNARKAAQVGTGLGLALVKRSVDRLRGRVVLASQEGVGTTVMVDLPVSGEGVGGAMLPEPTPEPGAGP